MGRFVSARYSASSSAPVGLAFDGTHNYAERVGKYVPAEVLAAQITATGIAMSLNKYQLLVAAGTFVICLILTPLYVIKMTTSRRERRVNCIMATIAFAVWSYSMGGVFIILKWHIPALGSILLILFSLASGLVTPTTKQSQGVA